MGNEITPDFDLIQQYFTNSHLYLYEEYTVPSDKLQNKIAKIFEKYDLSLNNQVLVNLAAAINLFMGVNKIVYERRYDGAWLKKLGHELDKERAEFLTFGEEYEPIFDAKIEAGKEYPPQNPNKQILSVKIQYQDGSSKRKSINLTGLNARLILLCYWKEMYISRQTGKPKKIKPSPLNSGPRISYYNKFRDDFLRGLDSYIKAFSLPKDKYNDSNIKSPILYKLSVLAKVKFEDKFGEEEILPLTIKQRILKAISSQSD